MNINENLGEAYLQLYEQNGNRHPDLDKVERLANRMTTANFYKPLVLSDAIYAQYGKSVRLFHQRDIQDLQCKACHQVLPQSAFYPKLRFGQFYTYTNLCRKCYSKRYYQRNWYKNPERRQRFLDYMRNRYQAIKQGDTTYYAYLIREIQLRDRRNVAEISDVYIRRNFSRNFPDIEPTPEMYRHYRDYLIGLRQGIYKRGHFRQYLSDNNLNKAI
jgi:hypothetical protein